LLAAKKFLQVRIFSILFLFIFSFISFSPNYIAGASDLVDVDTKYSRVWIYPSQIRESKRDVLNLVTDPFSVQSSMFLDGDDELVHRYAKYYNLADYFNPDIRNALMLGGAAYSYPRDFLSKHKESKLTVVEIDEGMTKLAKKYFRLQDDPNLKIVHTDGRFFLNNNQEQFDAIFVDAFTSRLSIPHQLTTKEAVELFYSSLTKDGIMMINLISAIDGDKGKFLKAEYATYKSVFPYLYLFVADNREVDSVHNLILVVSKKELNLNSDNSLINEYLDTEWKGEIKTDMQILTDDYAPVDYYIKNLVQ